MAKPTRLYWDACAWLGLIKGEAGKSRELELVYDSAKKGKYELWTSTLSMVECRRIDGEINSGRPWSDENEQLIVAMFNQPFVKPVSMGVDIAEDARSLFRTTPNLGKWQDGIHLASARRWNIPTFHTYDHADLLHLSGKLQCYDGTPLIICYPDETTDGPLFAKRHG